MNSPKSVEFSQLIANRYSDLRHRLKNCDHKQKLISTVLVALIFIAISISLLYFIFNLNSNSKSKSVQSYDVNSNDTNLDLFDQLNQQCLDSHNYYRSLHGVVPLKLDQQLIDVAKQRATELVITDIFDHPNYEFKYGENLHYIMPFVKKYKCLKVVKSWYDEIKDYDYLDWRKSRGKIGHFTQVVWKSSQSLGCAQAYSQRSHRLYTVCNYSPPGNYIKRYKDNVPLPINNAI